MIKLTKHICALTALIASSAALATDSGWIISEADGQVSITRDSKFVYGAKGTRLQIGDVVRTGKGARAVLVRDEEYLVVTPQAQVRIAKAAESGAVAQAFQSLGDMLLGLENKATPKPRASRPVMAAVVKGYGRSGQKRGGSNFSGGDKQSKEQNAHEQQPAQQTALQDNADH